MALEAGENKGMDTWTAYSATLDGSYTEIAGITDSGRTMGGTSVDSSRKGVTFKTSEPGQGTFGINVTFIFDSTNATHLALQAAWLARTKFGIDDRDFESGKGFKALMHITSFDKSAGIDDMQSIDMTLENSSAPTPTEG